MRSRINRVKRGYSCEAVVIEGVASPIYGHLDGAVNYFTTISKTTLILAFAAAEFLSRGFTS